MAGEADGVRPSRWRAVRRWSARVVVALAGAVVAVMLAANGHHRIGPFETPLSVRPSWASDTVIRLGPLGTIRLDTHDSPLLIDARVDELRLQAAEAISEDPSSLEDLDEHLAADAREAIRWLIARAAL